MRENWGQTPCYKADGCLEANDAVSNSYNELSAKTNDSGACTIFFVECNDWCINGIPITPD